MRDTSNTRREVPTKLCDGSDPVVADPDYVLRSPSVIDAFRIDAFRVATLENRLDQSQSPSDTAYSPLSATASSPSSQRPSHRNSFETPTRPGFALPMRPHNFIQEPSENRAPLQLVPINLSQALEMCFEDVGKGIPPQHKCRTPVPQKASGSVDTPLPPSPSDKIYATIDQNAPQSLLMPMF